MGESRLDLAFRELDIALQNRVFEIQSFWQRSNYFLVLLTALGAATFTSSDNLVKLVLACLSACCSYLWYRTNLGSKFWQESWEVEVNLLSEEIGIESFKRNLKDVRAQVRKSLDPGRKGNSPLQNFIDKQVLSKPSVTYNMILLSLLVFVVWIFLSGVFAYRLFEDGVGSSLISIVRNQLEGVSFAW